MARAQAADPGGTAPPAAGFLLLEWRGPWPRDAKEVPALAGLGPALAAAGVRLQLVVPGADAEPGRIRLVAYRQGTPSSGTYLHRERVVPEADVVAAATDLVTGSAAGWTVAGGPVDVLVCGHGRRDACCGSLGTAVTVAAARGGRPRGPGVRVWRTSHLGGHRFAPTALVLPAGTMWAQADLDLINRVVDRRGPPADVLDRYRGSTGLASPAAQVVERHALAEVGWDWQWWGREVPVDDGDRVELIGRAPGGGGRRWEARVRPGRVVPVPPCGAAVDPATPTATELVVTDLRSTPLP